MMYCYWSPFTNVIQNIVVEKEKKLKEIMNIMGIPSWIHWSGWFVQSMFICTLSASLIVIFFKVLKRKKLYPIRPII